MWPCANDCESSGFVLVTALLYLFIITLLISYALDSSLLQIKISGNMQNQASAFQYAESALWFAEKLVQDTADKGQGELNLSASYYFEKLPQHECGVSYYQVNALGRQGKTQSKLQSLLLVPWVNQENCLEKHENKKRLSWIELD